MRGRNDDQLVMMVLRSPGDFVPADHPARRIKAWADAQLERMDRFFDTLYAAEGRPSVPPERLLKACLLTALFSVRSERFLCEQLDYNLLFRWFLDMSVTDRPFDPSVFAKNRDRLLASDAVREFFRGIVEMAREGGLLSDDHFSVDGTLTQAWASHKSFRPKTPDDGGGPPSAPPDPPSPANAPRDPEVDFHGRRRRNDTHQSTTDPEARLMRKGAGKEALLCFAAHALMDNRYGLCVDITVSQADGKAECEQALEMIRTRQQEGPRMSTVGADKYYDQRPFVDGARKLKVTPHVAAKAKGSAIDGRTTRHAGYRVSQVVRKRIEQIFGWMKTIGGFRRTRYRGTQRTGLWACVTAAAYNLVRMLRLLPAPADGAPGAGAPVLA